MVSQRIVFSETPLQTSTDPSSVLLNTADAKTLFDVSLKQKLQLESLMQNNSHVSEDDISPRSRQSEGKAVNR
jgi:hypothetical protein